MELIEHVNAILSEVQKAIVAKETITEKIMMAIIAKGHILVEDIPGVGKTTMALAFSKAMGLKEKRVQFTPDVLPADLTGFTIYRQDIDQFVYQPGAVMCNLLLADEINRTSPKTQSALLEVMEERQVTVDGITRKTENPFIVLATENPEGSTGTQLLPDSQLDRFMICISIGYPSVTEEIEILKRNQAGKLTDPVHEVVSIDMLLHIQEEVERIFVHDRLYSYIATLAKATREHDLILTGLSPRGTVALTAMSKAGAYLHGRNYIVPSDVADVFHCIAAHRTRLSPKAKIGHIAVTDVLDDILKKVAAPSLRKN